VTVTKEALEKKKEAHEGQLALARDRLAKAQVAVTELTQLVLRIEGAVLAVADLLLTEEPPAPVEVPEVAEVPKSDAPV